MAPAPGGSCDAPAGAAHPGRVRLSRRSGGSHPALRGLGFAAPAFRRADRCSPSPGRSGAADKEAAGGCLL